LSGLIKVYSRYEEKELLLYYIQPGESYIKSFAAALGNEPSKVFAVTEDNCRTLLLPVIHLPRWLRNYPAINLLFFDQYKRRYSELLETIHFLLYHKLDQRIMDYLSEKSMLLGTRTLDIRHRQIAAELGTSREVISRLVKKLEKEGKLKQLPDGIELR